MATPVRSAMKHSADNSAPAEKAHLQAHDSPTQGSTPPDHIPGSKDRAWRVIHACNSIRSVAELVEAQIAAGMRPFVLTGDARPQATSLLQTWNEVRAWRSYLEGTHASDYPLQSSVVHAHSFPAAMAAMRAGLTTVYDVHTCVEDFAVTSGQCTERSWLARSFRTAEEFLLPRAGAVVVHSALLHKACLERGVADADLFLVPRPLRLPPASNNGWLRRAFDFSENIVTIFARPTAADDETLLRAFAQTAAEVSGVRLFIATGNDQAAQLRRFAHEYAVEELIFVLSREDEDPALAAADIVLAGWPVFPDDSSWGRMNALSIANSGTALAAMAHGRCLLAADCSAHRDLTPQGRGCLWYGAGKITDSKDKASELAHRLAFLARNPDFRRALAETARQHLAQSRDPERIGKRYREVYRHAELRRHRGEDAPGQRPLLVPSQART